MTVPPQNRSGALRSIIMFALLVAAAEPLFAQRPLTRREDSWVRQTLSRMSLAEKIGQMITVNTNAVFMNRRSEEFAALRRHVVENRIGGLILSRSDVWATAILTNRLQQLARIPLLIAADLEMGPGMRLDETTWWAPNMAVAATGEVRYARLQGEFTAREARAIGINWLYAPVADVNNNPENPVINTRSYGEDPEAVAAFTAAFIEGAQRAGALATAKHFPGHGDTATDSHNGLPVIDVSRQRLDELELKPFRSAIAAGVGSIMSAHIALPQIDNSLAPATLSPRILRGILREDLGFKGLIVTDAMEMAGITQHYAAAEAAVTAVKAGADMILKTPDVDGVIAGLRQAVLRGEISEPRINESVTRILRAKAAVGLVQRRTVDVAGVDETVSDPRFNAVADEIAERSITLVRDQPQLLPLATQPVLVVTFSDDDNGSGFGLVMKELRAAGYDASLVALDRRSTAADIDLLRVRLAAHSGTVVHCVSVRTQSGKGNIALPDVGVRVTGEVLQSGRPAIVISFGNPYLLQAIPSATTYVTAFSPYPVSQRAAVRALIGAIPIRGKLPVSIPGFYARGHGLVVGRRNE